MNNFYIENRLVNANSRPLVIAEIGINHNGSLAVAKKMVDAAASGGAEVIKHQTHITWDEMSKKAKDVYPRGQEKSIYEIMESCALSLEEEVELKRYIESKGCIFLSTPFSREAAYRLEEIGVSAYKIGSGECNNYPLLKIIGSYMKPVILSTGMNNIESVNKACKCLLDSGAENVALMHTTNIYPTPPHLVRLGGMEKLMSEFPDLVVGLSDHTTSNLACFAAAAKGAKIFERHFTDTMQRKGPDIICSMNKKSLTELISGLDQITSMLGGEKEPTPEEQPTIAFAFASVVAIKDIKAGEVLSEENIWVRRPGGGDFLAESYELLLGKKTSHDISSGSQIKRAYIDQ